MAVRVFSTSQPSVSMSSFKSVCLCLLSERKTELSSHKVFLGCGNSSGMLLTGQRGSSVLINCCCNKDHKGNRKWHRVTLSPLTVKVAVMEHVNFVHSLETEEFIIVTGFSMHIVFLDVSNAVSFHTTSIRWSH